MMIKMMVEMMRYGDSDGDDDDGNDNDEDHYVNSYKYLYAI